MSALGQLKILYHLALSPIRGETHQQRLESFYRGQAEHYDATRQRMLHGRDELFAELPAPSRGTWVDLGCGTARNAEAWGERIKNFDKAILVDLSESLLGIAQKRVDRQGWTNVELRHADATTVDIAPGSVDVVTFAYSLTMIPNWFAAIDHAITLLKPGGTLGVVDFYIAKKFPAEGQQKHSWFTRTFWPAWFGMDNVHPNPDLLPYLQNRFQQQHLTEQMGKIIWIPVLKMPYFYFVGQKTH